eukprot:gb/GECG01015768.1/.p1 GENE.gb/GECG01015768.1/~~gb/GECG01015768.1/.p1  ORF type:complete len:911 (+),score=96.42 gb/GECG01015768.1/:1-2733(+)
MSVEVSSEDQGLDLEPIQYLYLKGGELLHGIPQEDSKTSGQTQLQSQTGHHGRQTAANSNTSITSISQQYRSLIAEVVQQLEDMGDAEDENSERATRHCAYLQVSLSVWHLMEIFIIRPAEERSRRRTKDPSTDVFTTIRFAEWLNELCVPTVDETEVNEVLVKIRNGQYPPPDIWRSVAHLLSNAQIVEAANILKASSSLMYSEKLRSVVDVLQRFPLVSSTDMPSPPQYEDNWREWFLATRALRRSIPPDMFYQFKVLEPLFDLFDGENVVDALTRLKLIASKMTPAMSEEQFTEAPSSEDAEVGWMNVAICSLFFKQPITQVSVNSLDNLFWECIHATGADPNDWIFRCFSGCLRGEDTGPLRILLDEEQRWVVAHLLEVLHWLGCAQTHRKLDHPTWGARLNRGLLLDVAIDLLSMPHRTRQQEDDTELGAEDVELSPLLRVPALYAKYVSREMGDMLYFQLLPSKLPYLSDDECQLLHEFLVQHNFEGAKELLVHLKLRKAFASLYRRRLESTQGKYSYHRWIADPGLTIAQYEEILRWGNLSNKPWLLELGLLLFQFCSYLVENLSSYKADDIWFLVNAFRNVEITRSEETEKLEKAQCLLWATGLIAYIKETNEYIRIRQSSRGENETVPADEGIEAQQALVNKFCFELCCILHDAFLGSGRNGIKSGSADGIPVGLPSLPAIRNELFPTMGAQIMSNASHGYAPVSPFLRNCFNFDTAIKLLGLACEYGAFNPRNCVCTAHLVSGFLNILQQLKLRVSGLQPSMKLQIEEIQDVLRKYYPYAVLHETGNKQGMTNPFEVVQLAAADAPESPSQTQPSHTPHRAVPVTSSRFTRTPSSAATRGIATSKRPPAAGPDDTLPSPPAFAVTPERQSTSVSKDRGTLTEQLNRLQTPPSLFSRGYMS